MYRGFGGVPERVLTPTTTFDPTAPGKKVVVSSYTAAQAAPPVQLLVPSLDANTYTSPAVESTIGPGTKPPPKSNWPDLLTAAVVELTRYKNPPASSTNTFPDAESRIESLREVGALGFTRTGHPFVLTSVRTPFSTGVNLWSQPELSPT